MFINVYVHNKNCDSFNLFRSDYMDYKIGVNMDDIRLYLIGYFSNDKLLKDLPYKIYIEQRNEVLINVFFDHDICLIREIQIDKIIDD